jgi:primary-amine oxidase
MMSVRLRFVAGAAGAVVLAFSILMAAASSSTAQNACDNLSFPAAGTQWTLCWELRQIEGLVINTADYKDKGGVSRRVLFRGSLAEVHVPYHSGFPRYLDLAWDTAGFGANALVLPPAECKGVLVDPKVCRETHSRGYAWKFCDTFTGNCTSKVGEEVTYWISSQLGTYNYLTRWTFRDDGSFRPELGLTGRLQIFRYSPAYVPFGSRINHESASPPEIGINHMHNVYWRLDLDVTGSLDDAVNRITQVQHTASSPEPDVDCTIAGTCQTNQHTRLSTEVVERLTPFKTWHQIDRGTSNADIRPIGYEIIPEGNQLWTGPSSEPWAAGELYVTRYNSCERFAAHNNHPAVNPGCDSAAPDVQAMVNAEAVDGADIVLWYNAHYQHVIRDEDQPDMLIDYMGFELRPRSWRHVNTLQ